MTYSFHSSDDLIGISNSLEKMIGVKEDLERYEVTKSSLLILKAVGLMSSTSFMSIGTEDFNEKLDEKHTSIALENLAFSIKDKVAQWSAKLLASVKSISVKIMNDVKERFDGLISFLNKMKDKSKSKLDDVKSFVKAHPYKTILGIILSIAAVGSIVYFSRSGLANASKDSSSLKTFLTRIKTMTEDIKWPFGSKISNVNKSGIPDIVVNNITNPEELQSLEKLGWTRKSVDYLLNKIKDVYTLISKTVDSLIQTILDVSKKTTEFILKSPPEKGQTSYFSKAQNLDNISRDHYGINGNVDYSSVKETVEKISDIALSQKSVSGKVSKINKLKVYLKGNKFFIQTPSLDKDSVGRFTSTITGGTIDPTKSASSQVESILETAKKFASNINRTLDTAALDEIKPILESKIEKHINLFKGVNTTITASFIGIISALTYYITKLMYKVVVQGLRCLKNTFTKLFSE